MQQKINDIIKKHLVPAENYIYGFADLKGLIDQKFKNFNYGISIGRKLDYAIVDNIAGGPDMQYYFHYRMINEELSSLSQQIASELNEFDIETITISPTVSIADLDSIYFNTLRTDISHKMVATRAGLGWIGKTDLLISKKFGPRLRLTSILIRESVISECKPIDKSRCGACNLCVEICPAKAANGKMWDITIERDQFFDAQKCRNQCAEFGRSRLSMDARVCGICVAACPIGQEHTSS